MRRPRLMRLRRHGVVASVRMAAGQRWSVREVVRKIDGALFERAVLNPPKVSTALREVHPAAEAIFRDAYFVEFLDLPDGYHETDLHAALLQNMRRFLAELGRDFCFIGSEVPLQVGGKDGDVRELTRPGYPTGVIPPPCGRTPTGRSAAITG